ncbi:glycosyltransferase family 2 protein [Mariniphaga sediminis]|uniref:Glycosyltransferase family 2 protein n=2 Tax=Mariniphaga sediminis TaxID=1628158 RepID=A0A399D6T4_9BACT|nr:glycosyltransferase family 2 protein [Mariniphaga sediminis]
MMIAVVIPCYKVRNHILDVLQAIGNEVSHIYIVDDACPENSGEYVEKNTKDPRIKVIYHEKNKGVGGAVITGYKEAISDGAEIVVKLDGDGQMNPDFIPKLVIPIETGEADYSKGNRFFDVEKLLIMPRMRLIGNSFLSLINKMVNGYWNIIDPTNGFTAIHVNVLKLLPLNKIDNRYFFESDMLFRLSVLRAVVKDIPISPVYGNEKSNLIIGTVLWEFPMKYVNRFLKRFFYCYLLRDFNAGTMQFLGGLLAIIVGLVFGIYHWVTSYEAMSTTPAGTVMIAALLIILGFQLLLSALNFDIQNIPHHPIQKQ